MTMRARWPSWLPSTTSSRSPSRTRTARSWASSPSTTSWRRCSMGESRAVARATPSGGVRPFRSRWAHLALLISVVGPGIITANVDNDAGGIATYSQAGAEFGYSLLWTLIPITFALILVQEMTARMGVVTGKGLSDLIHERFGVKATFYVMLALVVANLGNTVAEFAGVAGSMEIFGVPRWVSVPAVALLVWALVVKGTARIVERIFLAACTFYVAYIIAGFLAKPDWGAVARGTFIPTLEFNGSALTMVVTLVGTTIAPWMQFYLQSAIVEKGVRIEDYRLSRIDVIVGCIVTDVAVIFIGSGLVTLPNLPLLKIMLLSQAANGVLLPFILVFMLLLAGDERLMGRYRNSRWLSISAWLTTAVLIVLTFAMLWLT